ncbi:P-II family nitrogen regulator [Nitrosopumilus sp. S4]
MKSICAIIPEKKLTEVNNALHKIGISGLTIFDTKGRGKNLPEPNQMGHWLYFSEFGDSNALLILSNDSDVEKIIETIKATAGIGKIFVTNIEELIDIQKNTKGEEAL